MTTDDATTRADGRSPRGVFRAHLVLALAALGLVAVVLVPEPGLLESEDFIRQHEVYRDYARAALLAGRFPAWNPHVGLGRPFATDPEAGLFYPPNLLYLPLGTRPALLVLVSLHLLLAMAGMAALARRFGARDTTATLAGVAFGASLPMVGIFLRGEISYAFAATWAPAVMAAGLSLVDAPAGRRRAPLGRLAAAWAMSLLAGNPQVAWMTLLGLAILAVGRAGEGRSAHNAAWALAPLPAALGLGALAAAALYLPFSQLVIHGNRTSASFARAASYAVTPRAWLSLLGAEPGALLDNLHVGGAVLVAALAGLATTRSRSRRAVAVLGLVAAGLAAGDHTPIFRGLYHLIPGVSLFRAHARAGLLLGLAAILGAVSWWESAAGGTGPRRLDRALAVAGALVLAVAALWLDRWAYLISAGALAMTGVLMSYGLARADGKRRLVLLGLAAAFSSIELGRAIVEARRASRHPTTYAVEPLLARALAAEGLLAPGAPPPRVSVPYPAIRELAGMVHGWSTFAVHGPLTPDRLWRYLYGVHGMPLPPMDDAYVLPSIYRIGAVPYHTMAIAVGFDPVRLRLHPVAKPDLRVYLAGSVAPVESYQAAIERLRAGHPGESLPLVEEAVLPPAVARGSDGAAAGSNGRARIASFSPERIEIETDGVDRPSVLVLAETWFPGWSATVDGAPADVFPANSWQRAVAVPTGARRVVMEFHTRFLAPGVALSAVAWAAIAALAMLGRVRPPTR